MNKTTINGKELLIVPVPAFVNYAEVCEWLGEYELAWEDPKEVLGVDSVKLPPGKWQYLFQTSTCTEEEAAALTPALALGGYFNYEYSDEYSLTLSLSTALESLTSLLLSLGLDTGNNYAFLQLIKD